jgi:predicted dehydrogenase
MKKFSWGLIGGGRESQIGPAHRLGATVDGNFEFVAGALDANPDEGRKFSLELGLEENRAYGDWKEMLLHEKKKVEKLDLVTIATPNSTHFEISKAFLEAGFNIFCEKPMTMNIEEGEALLAIAKKADKICAVNYGYSGFSLVREMKSMVNNNVIGKIRLVKAEFAHGHHADEADAGNPRVRWRYDPAQAGVSAVMADCGIHALHMACFVCGEEVLEVSADFVSTIASRELEDDAMVNFRMTGGIVGRLWSSAIALGRQHGLTIQVFGEKGGLRWSQEYPNQLYFTPLGARTEIIERGDNTLSSISQAASRVTIGHSEGMPLAFANIYVDIANALSGKNEGISKHVSASKIVKPIYPNAEDGLRSIAAVHAAQASSMKMGKWMPAVPLSLKIGH